jgi:pimeloyl-ACP methyl ester carboxylesterase
MSDVMHQRVRSNGINMHIAEAGQGPLVVLLHGFPELWYSWRHQLPALAEAGYHALAPDLRGYGETDAPEAVESYSMLNMTADVVGVLDALGAEMAVLVGHDWGARIAWDCARLYPRRVTSVAALSVPFYPRPQTPPLQAMKQSSGEAFSPIMYFQEPGVAEARFKADVRRTLHVFFNALSGDAPPDLMNAFYTDARILKEMPEPEALPAWLTEADLDYYTRAYERTGFRGPLNLLRNMDRDWEEMARVADVRVEQPVLFVAGDRDSTIRFGSLEPMKASVPNLRKVVLLPGCGHWTQQERPDEVNTALIDFLRSESER